MAIHARARGLEPPAYDEGFDLVAGVQVLEGGGFEVRPREQSLP